MFLLERHRILYIASSREAAYRGKASIARLDLTGFSTIRLDLGLFIGFLGKSFDANDANFHELGRGFMKSGLTRFDRV
jgi:hypothetical protein